MAESLKQTEQQFLDYVKKMTAYNEAIGLMYWDMRTGAPKQGMEQRSEVIGMISSEVFRMSTSEEMAAYIAKLTGRENLSEVTVKTLEECKRIMTGIRKFLRRNTPNMSSCNPRLRVFGKMQRKVQILKCSSLIWKSLLK